MKKIVLSVLIFTVSILFSSCTKQGCADYDAENYDPSVQEDDGSCTYAYEKFIGIYTVYENFTSDNCGSSSDTYTVTIYPGLTKNEIYINNFAGGFNGVKFNVNGNIITAPYQYGLNSQAGYYDLNSAIGSTNNDGNTIELSYNIDDILYDYTCGYVNGNALLIKQ
jgi:hypothetical protein